MSGAVAVKQPGVKEMALVPAADVVEVSTVVSIFERLARDPAMDVDKFERLMQMHERATARQAEERFNAAMSLAQTDMRPIAADASNPQTRSKYASYGAIDRILRPIYTKHGFGLSFDTGAGASEGWVRVQCYVTHAAGFSRTYHVDMPADGKGAKGGDVMTLTHAVGAAMSYGMRYLLKMIFNVAIGEDDRDGNAGGSRAQTVTMPPGYDAWLLNLESVVPEGIAKLQGVWNDSARAFKLYTVQHNREVWERLKTKAQQVRGRA